MEILWDFSQVTDLYVAAHEIFAAIVGLELIKTKIFIIFKLWQLLPLRNPVPQNHHSIDQECQVETKCLIVNGRILQIIDQHNDEPSKRNAC